MCTQVPLSLSAWSFSPPSKYLFYLRTSTNTGHFHAPCATPQLLQSTGLAENGIAECVCLLSVL